MIQTYATSGADKARLATYSPSPTLDPAAAVPPQPRQQRGTLDPSLQLNPSPRGMEGALSSTACRPTARSNAAALRSREAKRDYFTVFLVAKANERGMDTIPREASKALSALAEQHGDELRQLPASEMGGGIFSPREVYKVKPSLLPQVEAIVAQYPELSLVRLDDVLQPSGTPQSYGPEVLAALQGTASAAKTLALRSVHAALTSGAPAFPVDAETRNAIGDAVYDAVGEYVHLFNATLLEASRERREQLLPAERAKANEQQHGTACGCPTCFEIGKALNAYFGASSRAIDELRRAGGTPELLAAGDLLLMGAEVLGALGTPRARGLQLQTLLFGDGVVMAALVRNSAAVQAVVEASLSVVRSRLDQTAVALTHPLGERLDGWTGYGSSGGYDNLPGSTSQVSGYLWTKDYPFDRAPVQFLFLLGTEQCAFVRREVTQLLLQADAGLPNLLALHEAQYIAREMKGAERFIERHSSTVPEAERATRRAEWLAEQLKEAHEKYRTGSPLTCQYDVASVINGLSSYGFGNPHVYAEPRAFIEVAGILADVLAKVKTPQMHRQLADAALSTLRRYDAREIASPETTAAAERLRAQLSAPGPDPEVHLAVAAHFARNGGAVDAQRLDEGLQHANDEVQRLAMAAVQAVIAKGRSGELAALAPTFAKLLTSGVSIWTRLNAAEVLGTFQPGHPEALALATSIFAPDVTYERTGANWSANKNYAMRKAAAEALAAHCGAAAQALPALDAAVAVGQQAHAVFKRVEEKRKASSNYDLLADAETLALVKAALQAAAWSVDQPYRRESSAARVLRYLADPTAQEFASIPSYSGDRPSPEGELYEIAGLGEAAAKAAQAIRGAANN